MQWFNIFVGAALLFFGRRLFWLFVAGVGFVIGAKVATDSLAGQPEWLIFVIALGVGVIGAILSVFLQRLVIGIAGFFAGGFVLQALALELNYGTHAWIAFFVGGLLGAFLVMVLLDWALIILSALTGTTVIIDNTPLDQPASALLFIVLLILGAGVQAGQLTQKTPPPKQREDG